MKTTDVGEVLSALHQAVQELPDEPTCKANPSVHLEYLKYRLALFRMMSRGQKLQERLRKTKT